MGRSRTATEERILGQVRVDKGTLRSREPAFCWMDKNSDAFVTREDLMTLAKSWGLKISKHEASDILDSYDVDKDGKISKDDYATLLGSDMEYTHHEDLRCLFDLCDSDGDGYLVKEDVKKLFRYLGEEPSSEKLSILFKSCSEAEKKKKMAFEDFISLIFR